MDFLDPKKRKAHRLRLMTGYVLVAMAVGLGTIILVYDAYGYGINSKGDIIQNGLLFVGSQPGGAQIYLDGNSQNATTSARLVLPAKDYQLSLKKDGYREWQRSFTLNEHSISRYVYPLLIPQQFSPEPLKEYSSVVPLASQSPDYRWLLLQQPEVDGQSIIFDEFDTENTQDSFQKLTLPANLMTDAKDETVSLREVEWSTDNRHLLLQRSFKNFTEFIIFDREEPANSININQLFKVNPKKVAFRDRQADQVYIYLAQGGLLRVGDLDTGNLATAFLQNVIDFKPYGSRLISYATKFGDQADQVSIRIWDNGQNYELTKVTSGKRYLMDIAQFQGDWYYVAGSDNFGRLNIYKNPLNSLAGKSASSATPLLALKQDKAQKVSFSNNARFVGVQSGSNFAVYDFEQQDTYAFNIDKKFASNLKWMDGHRWVGLTDDNVTIFDYDGSNQHILVPSAGVPGAFFDRNYELMFTLPGSKKTTFSMSEMRAGSDLPN